METGDAMILDVVMKKANENVKIGKIEAMTSMDRTKSDDDLRPRNGHPAAAEAPGETTTTARVTKIWSS